jgi:hypothetical protein
MAVGTFQKEIRDSIKMLYDIQKKMKDFYKEIKKEMEQLNKGESTDGKINDVVEIVEDDDDDYSIIDMTKLNREIDEYMSSNKKKKE